MITFLTTNQTAAVIAAAAFSKDKKMSNFWHNNTENPKKNEVIMGQHGFVGLFDGEFVIFNDVANHPNKLLLKDFCNSWAYLSRFDLFQERLKDYEDVLKFYADTENYKEQEYRTPHCHSQWLPPAIMDDNGEKARAVLEKKGE